MGTGLAAVRLAGEVPLMARMTPKERDQIQDTMTTERTSIFTV
jgi:hypothetical protein